MYIEAKNRNNGKTIIAKLRERPKVEIKKKIRIPNTISRNVG